MCRISVAVDENPLVQLGVILWGKISWICAHKYEHRSGVVDVGHELFDAVDNVLIAVPDGQCAVSCVEIVKARNAVRRSRIRLGRGRGDEEYRVIAVGPAAISRGSPRMRPAPDRPPIEGV